MFLYTGDYKKHTLENEYRMDYYSFTPAPLVRGVSINMDEELFILITTAHRLLGLLEGILMHVPNGAIIKRLLTLKECCYSRLIDNEDTFSFYNVLKALSAKKSNISSITNMVAAQEYSYGKPAESIELCKIRSIILNGTEAEGLVSIRDKQIFLRNVVTNLKIYSPTAPEDIPPALLDIYRFITADNYTDIFIKAALVHYQFEIIHPFECCNGLIGRILMLMVLFNAEYKAAPFLCISEYLYLNRNEYFNMLSSTQTGAGYLRLVKFFLHAICSSASRVLEQIKHFTNIVNSDEEKILDQNLYAKTVSMVYGYFKRNLVSEIKPISIELGISFNTVSSAAKKLIDIGILEIEYDQSRHRQFVYNKLLNSVNETWIRT